MEVIRNIVKLTPEQYMELLKNGEVEVNGEIKTYSENTLYDTGNLELLEWYNKMMEAQHKQLKPAHTPYIIKTLEDRIEDIIKEYPNYQTSSVVAYKAFLKNGDTIEVNNSSNNGEVFINGKLATGNYTYMGNDIELIDVVVFETGYYSDKRAGGIKLNATPTYYPFEIIIKSLNILPEIEQSYYLYAEKIMTYAFNLPVQPRAARIIKADGTDSFTQIVSPVIQEVSSNCEFFSINSGFKSNPYIETIKLPNCKTLDGRDYGMFAYCTNLRNWEFGELTTVKSTSAGQPQWIMFNGTHTVYIPETVKVISGIICCNNKSIRLDCNRATNIDSKWCSGAPANLTMADDWRATINIAVAAKNWTTEQFMDFAENKLARIEPDGGVSSARFLTIPVSKASQLEELGFYTICEAKGWAVDEA